MNRMSKSILITGGASSGKSRWAATYFAACDYVLYIKAGGTMSKDTRDRIAYSNKQHEVEWDILPTEERCPSKVIGDHKFVIFDSLGSFTREIMSDICPDPAKLDEQCKKEIERRVISEVTDMREIMEEKDGCIVVITIETGFSAAFGDMEQAFGEILGRVNQRIANTSDDVYFSASGIQFKIK